MPIETYLSELSEKFATGRAGEHAYRPAFERLVATLDPTLKIVNDPKRTEFGAPDFIFSRGDLIAGYAETKDVDGDLNKTEASEQLKRYFGYSNLVLTNYLEFRFFRNGERYGEPFAIGKIEHGKIVSQPEDFPLLASTLRDFLSGEPEQIKSGTRLAKIMGGKARRIRDNVRHFLSTDSDKNRELERVYETVKRLLVHDLSPEAFADMYAQTVVYGLFAARFNDDATGNFTRQKARDLVPASNPFLRHFFDHIVGPEFDKRLAYIVNELCDVFSHADVRALMNQYFKSNGKDGPDPVIHFYEDFLKEYDAEQRKKLGAFYTPLPVVRFIVRSVDTLLEKEFALPKGLADTAKISVDRIVQGKKVKIDTHRIQILDPAAGTGTFLNETIRTIANRFANQTGRWSTYVDSDLLPRLHGFELMMAPYTIAHLKLGMTLRETGYTSFDRRLGIYLTNSLEEADTFDDTLFAALGLSSSIAEEAREAGFIKRDTPIMVVIGNPPYSVSSSNKSAWIQDLIRPYKEGLGERKINLDDDYIKFIRFAEHFIEKNGTGVVAMITNNSFIDGITHRQMRKHLLDTFDTIHVLDLHGNLKKKEKALDGGKDENVFDIQQGVAISIFVRTNPKKKGVGVVYHSELWGKREAKFAALDATTLDTIAWQKLDCQAPYYFFVPKDFGAEDEYKNGFSVAEIFSHYNSGIQTKRDDVTVQFDENSIDKITDDFENLAPEEIRSKYSLPADGRDWKVAWAQEDIRKGFQLERMQYRPFDTRYTAYTGRSKGFLAYPREQTNKHIAERKNLSLLTSRMIPPNQEFDRAFVTVSIADIHAASDQTYVFPLYVYADDGTRVSNLNKDMVAKIGKKIGAEPTPEDVFDYIYAVLYSPEYRKKYSAFLKIDFPRIPYPSDRGEFERLVNVGRELRSLHLLESPKLDDFVTTYSIAGDNRVEKITRDGMRVFINATQYFGNVPDIAWDFRVGGYLPAQKWLKDRKGRALSNEEIEHYQKLIVALVETARIMGEMG